jgi:hypothetical protein
VRSTTHLLGWTVKAGRGAGSTCSNTSMRRAGGRTVMVVHPKVCSNPVFALSTTLVARIEPDMRQAWALPFGLLRRQQKHHAITIHPISGMHVHPQEETLRIHGQMLLASLDFLGSIIPSLASDPSRVHTLALSDASTGLGLPAKGHTEVSASLGMELCPDGFLAPAPKVGIHGFPLREVVG